MAMLSIATALVTLGLKFGAYLLTGSVSLWSDAMEALVNLAAGAVALGALTIASRPADEKHRYGHAKTEYFSSGVTVVMFVPAWSILDPLLAIAVAVYIVHTGFDLLKRSVDGLMDAALPPQEVQHAERIIRDALPPDTSFHALRTRKAGAQRFLEFHILVPGATRVADAHALCDDSSLMGVFKLRLNRIRRPGSPDVHRDFVRTRATHDEIISVAP